MHYIWLRKPRAVVFSAVFVLALIAVWAPRPAAAISVTVGDFIYDLTVLTPGQSFNDANAANNLTATSWWGDRRLTSDLANAYALVASPLAAPVRFAFSSPIGFLVASYQAAAGSVGITLDFASRGGGSAFVTGTRRQIPEIDGALVPRLALIVLAAYLVVLTIRRNRGLAMASAGAAVASRLPVRPGAKPEHVHADQEVRDRVRGDRV